MVVYLFVLASHHRLAEEYGGHRGFILFVLLTVLAVFLLLLHYPS